eukprot:CAMPEP_0176478554 /NCGR_PEP_ID=MMETSP0200_2-20121128/1249_1 /TAXON_ID=947934 /ORGANISM="Chaetoceros sp., Strain GSL56" /LENGTH=387 /DNA_ID=CAMNT_0017874501 /DNA_START=1009 /DNA_END=2173 /DNA_ORIENTATION=-
MTTAEISSSFNDLWADSKHGISLLSQSRQVEQNNNKQNNNNKNNNQNKNYANQVDTTWISGYSLKFQGCHQVSQWNPNVDQEEDVRIESKRLARFRLCPASSCSSNSGGGCANGYGDYIVDMDTFLQNFMQNKRETCEAYAQYNCSCQQQQQQQNNNNAGDSDQQTCFQQCYYNAGMSECIEQNNSVFAVSGYQAAANGGGRLLENKQGNNANGNNVQYSYYIGPYCSGKGGKIVLGMFTDDSCTQFADSNGGQSTFQSLTGGMSLPYASTSMVDTKCYSCESAEKNKYYQAQTKDSCSQMYIYSGKCETQLSSSTSSVTTINQNACTYMEGIKITRSNGIIISGAAKASKVASVFTGIFAVSFVLLGSYVYYLKTKLDRGSVNLSD